MINKIKVAICSALFCISSTLQSSIEQDARALRGITALGIYTGDKGEGDIETKGEILLHGIKPGPSTDYVFIIDSPPENPIIDPDQQGHYTGRKLGSWEFDAISCVGIFTNMHQRMVADLKWLMDLFPSNTNLRDAFYNLIDPTNPVGISIRSITEKNAYYRETTKRGKVCKTLEFGRFEIPDPKNRYANKTIDMAQAPEIVAHESMHALIATIRHDMFSSHTPQTSGLNESLADLGAIFNNIDIMSLAEAAILESTGNLHKPELFICTIAEEAGEAFGKRHGLRNADDNADDIDGECHDVSQTFTGLIWDVLASALHEYCGILVREYKIESAVDSFRDLAKYLRRLILHTLVTNKTPDPTFKSIGESLITSSQQLKETYDRLPVKITCLPDVNWEGLIRREFAERDIRLTERTTLQHRRKAPIALGHY